MRAAPKTTAAGGKAVSPLRREGTDSPGGALPAYFAARLFPGLFGAFLGLSLLKFGTPPIFEDMTTAPANGWEFVFGTPWPIAWAYGLLAVLVLCALPATRWRARTAWWLPALTVGWLVWQVFAASESVGARFSVAVLEYFAACAVCFWLGFFALTRSERLTGFWLGLLAGFAGVIAVGWWDHFGGLEETRRYFYAYHDLQAERIPPEFIKRMSSNRIFATLFYPNALAGAIVLLAPPLLTIVARAERWFTLAARVFLAGSIGLGAVGCLYWSGSKGGWLLLLLLALLALLRLDFSKRLKLGLVAVVLVAGIAGFAWRYAAFFKKGATSVVARFDYWQAAGRIVLRHPWLGTGPGTFGISYKPIKPPNAEMAWLTHNDYLEQACDSGIPAALLYLGLVAGALVWSFPRAKAAENSRHFALWLGVLGWALHSSFEFVLYVPALAWPAMAFLGYLAGRRFKVPG